ncbi:MAG: TonB-dependent siderophore receptor [Rhodocyclaceae bacterium]
MNKRVRRLPKARIVFQQTLISVLVTTCFEMAHAEEAVQLKTIVVSGQAEEDAVGLKKKSATGSRLGLSIKEIPATVSLVDREMIEARGVASTQEALKSVPGITTSSAPGSPGAVYYRGFSGGSVTQLFNGITVQYDAIAARPIDSWIYDQVEAIGGPSTFMYGAGAVGGSINYVSKIANREGNATEAKAGYGSYGSTQLAVGSNQKVADKHYVRFDVNRNAMNGWSDHSKREAWQAATSWLWDLTPNVSHTLALEYQKETVDRPYWGTPLLKPVAGKISIDEGTRFKNYNSQDGLYEQEVRWARSILEIKASEQLRFKNTLYHYDALRDYRNVETYAFNAGNSAVSRGSPYLQRHDQTLNGNRFEFNWDSQLFSLRSDWAGGIDYSRNEQTRFPSSASATVSTVNPYNFTTGNFFDESGLSKTYTPDKTVKVNTLALYLENRTKLTRDLALLTGLRHDDLDLEVTNYRAVNALNPAYFKRNYQPVTGRVALAYDLTPNANAYVQYSTAADPPAGILTTASFAQVRDFDLARGKQWEVGSKFSFNDGKGSGTLSYFNIERKNIAVTDPADRNNTIPVGKQTSRGIELSAAYKLTSSLQLAGNVSHVRAAYDEFNETVGSTVVSRAGNRPTNTPENVANLWLTYKPDAHWETGADYRYVSSRYADTANTIYHDSYQLLGAFVTYKLDRKTKITLRGKNLSDTIYAENLGTSMVYLGAPRTIDLSIHTSF